MRYCDTTEHRHQHVFAKKNKKCSNIKNTHYNIAINTHKRKKKEIIYYNLQKNSEMQIPDFRRYNYRYKPSRILYTPPQDILEKKKKFKNKYLYPKHRTLANYCYQSIGTLFPGFSYYRFCFQAAKSTPPQLPLV